MRGRSIYNQTQLLNQVIQLAEISEDNGLIIALNHKKAYDCIAHDYMWKVLKAFNFPLEFIQNIKALYKDAATIVKINGEMSSPHKVTRGVRQGNPLLCLLFNLAIEPLAAMLRNSQLKGIQISNLTERLITSLFADDTTVYLSDKDKFSDLEAILKTWCKALKQNSIYQKHK